MKNTKQYPNYATEVVEKLFSLYRPGIPDRFNEMSILNYHFNRFVNILKGNKIPPYEVLIHPTTVCNLKCIWCIGKNLNGKGVVMPADELCEPDNMRKVVSSIIEYEGKIGEDDTKKVKIENVSFSGIVGEPLMARSSVLEALRLLIPTGRRVGIFTNGTLLDEEIEDLLLSISYVLISLDAGNGNTYSIMKCNGTESGKKVFYNVISNIERLTRKNRDHGTNKLKVNVGYVINQYNYREIKDAIKLCKDIGVRFFRVKTDIASIWTLTEKEKQGVRNAIDDAKALYETEEFKVVELHRIERTEQEEKVRKFTRCIVNNLVAAIGADGKLYPCNYHPNMANPSYYGSVLQEGFSAIWEGKRKSDIDSIIPGICPCRCDPFKNRANEMLEAASFALDSLGDVDALQRELECYQRQLKINDLVTYRDK